GAPRSSYDAAMRWLLLFAIACGPTGHGPPAGKVDAAEPKDAPCSTAITGTVFAPNGTLPLYNVSVYVPMTTPSPFPAGVQCGQCSTDLPGGSRASTTPGPDGTFRLDGVPSGHDFPVIVTTGKWRRQVTVPAVPACVDTAIPDGTLRLPKNH